MQKPKRVWQPEDRRGNVLEALAVPFNGLLITPNLFKSLLEDRLRDLVQADPQQAERQLQMSAEHMPELYLIARNNPPRDYPQQIVMSDQMQIILNRIDFQKGVITHLAPSEMPTLQEIVEMF